MLDAILKLKKITKYNKKPSNLTVLKSLHIIKIVNSLNKSCLEIGIGIILPTLFDLTLFDLSLI